MQFQNLSQKIIKLVQNQGFKKIKLSSVIETKYIRDENLKKYLFTFGDEKYCLRPDLSLMSLIKFSKTKNTKKKKISYSGEVYRKSFSKNKHVIPQIGYEIYNSNNQSDDHEVIKQSISIFKKIIKKKGYLKIGNIELFRSILNQLPMASRFKQRLMNNFFNKKYFDEILKMLEMDKYLDVSKIEIDKKLFNKMKKLDPNTNISGRRVRDILSNFDLKINIDPRGPEGKKSAKIIRKFLKIKCPIDKAPKILNDFFKKNKLNIKIAKDYFPIRKNKFSNVNIEFSASERPDVEIYSDLYFSIQLLNSKRKLVKILNGGRFNQLSNSLGLRPINAVGAAINLL